MRSSELWVENSESVAFLPGAAFPCTVGGRSNQSVGSATRANSLWNAKVNIS